MNDPRKVLLEQNYPLKNGSVGILFESIAEIINLIRSTFKEEAQKPESLKVLFSQSLKPKFDLTRRPLPKKVLSMILTLAAERLKDQEALSQFTSEFEDSLEFMNFTNLTSKYQNPFIWNNFEKWSEKASIMIVVTHTPAVLKWKEYPQAAELVKNIANTILEVDNCTNCPSRIFFLPDKETCAEFWARLREYMSVELNIPGEEINRVLAAADEKDLIQLYEATPEKCGSSFCYLIDVNEKFSKGALFYFSFHKRDMALTQASKYDGSFWLSNVYPTLQKSFKNNDHRIRYEESDTGFEVMSDLIKTIIHSRAQAS